MFECNLIPHISADLLLTNRDNGKLGHDWIFGDVIGRIWDGMWMTSYCSNYLDLIDIKPFYNVQVYMVRLQLIEYFMVAIKC